MSNSKWKNNEIANLCGMSRRQLIKAGAAGSLAVSGTLVSGGLAFASTPKKGGHARYGVRDGSATDSLDPSTYSGVFMRTLGYGTSNTLTGIGGDNSLVPELAESWQARAGGAEWEFKIRKGVEFHNGKTLDADDVIASIQHHRGEETKSGMKALLKPIKEIRKVDNNAVSFLLEGANADFPAIFADYRMMIMAAKDGKADWRDGNGTGGYVLKEFKPGISATLERAPNYWAAGERAFFDSAEIIRAPDVSARENGLISGSLDIIDQVNVKTVHLLKKNASVQVASTAGALHYTYPMNTQQEPFDNNDVRLALKYAVNREELVKKVLNGYGTVGNDHPVAPTMQFYAADLEQREFDPDKAMHHLKRAGLERLEVNLSVADALYAGATDGVALFKESAAKAGIDINIVRETYDGYYATVWMKKPFIASLWGARPTADLILSTAYAAGAAWNDTYFEHERFNNLLAEARGELDQSKRAEMYREMQIILRDEGGAIIPMFASNVFAMSSKIGSPSEMAGNWELDGGRSIERWWFK